MSSILDAWLRGEGLPDTLVIDGHIHVGEWPCGTTFNSAAEAAERSVQLMDANGVDACCALSGGYMWPGTDYRKGNDFLLDVCARLPDRMVGFMSLNPNDTWDNLLDELNRMYGKGIRCIKLINEYQDAYPGDGPNLMSVYEYAAESNMLVFNHWWVPDVIMRISAEFSGVDFVCGHYSKAYDPVMKARDNVYTSIWNLGDAGWLDRGYKNVGAGKFLMGSDGFLNSLSVGIGPVVFSDISDDEKRLILGLNQARLLGKVGALPEKIKEKLR